MILGPCWRCGSRQHLRAYCPWAATTSSPTRRATGSPTTALPAATTHFAQPAAATFLVRQYLSEAAAHQIRVTPEMTPDRAPEPPQVPAVHRTRWAQLQAKLAASTLAQAARRLEEAQQLEQDVLVQVAERLLLQQTRHSMTRSTNASTEEETPAPPGQDQESTACRPSIKKALQPQQQQSQQQPPKQLPLPTKSSSEKPCKPDLRDPPKSSPTSQPEDPKRSEEPRGIRGITWVTTTTAVLLCLTLALLLLRGADAADPSQKHQARRDSIIFQEMGVIFHTHATIHVSIDVNVTYLVEHCGVLQQQHPFGPSTTNHFMAVQRLLNQVCRDVNDLGNMGDPDRCKRQIFAALAAGFTLIFGIYGATQIHRIDQEIRRLDTDQLRRDSVLVHESM